MASRSTSRRPEISYTELVDITGEFEPSVVYHGGPYPKHDGTLIPGESVGVQEGMVFSVVNTGSA